VSGFPNGEWIALSLVKGTWKSFGVVRDYEGLIPWSSFILKQYTTGGNVWPCKLKDVPHDGFQVSRKWGTSPDGRMYAAIESTDNEMVWYSPPPGTVVGKLRSRAQARIAYEEVRHYLARYVFPFDLPENFAVVVSMAWVHETNEPAWKQKSRHHPFVCSLGNGGELVLDAYLKRPYTKLVYISDFTRPSARQILVESSPIGQEVIGMLGSGASKGDGPFGIKEALDALIESKVSSLVCRSDNLIPHIRPPVEVVPAVMAGGRGNMIVRYLNQQFIITRDMKTGDWTISKMG